jgi:hypothetical protein
MTQPAALDLSALTALAGAGGRTQVTTRWDVAAILHIDDETHLGGAGDPDPDAAVDQTLERDPVTGTPRLRVSTLAGLLRHHLLNRLDGYPATDADTSSDAASTLVESLFGSTEHASPLSGSDIPLDPPRHSGPATLLRTHNRVNPATHTAAGGALWSTEVVPHGTTGLVTLELAATASDEPDLLALLAAACDGLTLADKDPIAVGSRTRTGHGACHATGWVATRHDLTTPDGWGSAYLPDWDDLHAVLSARTAASAHTTLTDAVRAVLVNDPDAAQQFTAARERIPDRRHLDKITLTLKVGVPHPEPKDGVLAGLIRTGDVPPPAHADTDLAHRTTPRTRGAGGADASTAVEWVPVLGADSLHAVLRTAAHRIADHLAHGPDGPDRAADLIGRWFGDLPTTSAPRPGRVHVSEADLNGGALIRRQRLAIDPVFSDAITHLLFDELVQAGGTATPTLTVDAPDPAIRALLYYVIRDLAQWCPDPMGGGGHGHVTITAATLTIIDGRADTSTAAETPLDLLSPNATAADTLQGWATHLTSSLNGAQP